MMNKTRIGILGIGGVGGYIGGLLANQYANTQKVEIIFFAKEETVKVIKDVGLKLKADDFDINVRPTVISTNSNYAFKLDYLICTTKTYSLYESITPLKRCITENTVILPLLNGVDSYELLNNLFPKSRVLKGCIYLVSKKISAGIIHAKGNVHKVHFGTTNISEQEIYLKNIFQKANIECELDSNIDIDVWEKFIFISAIASLTSYLNLNIGSILSNSEYTLILRNLITEAISVASAKGIIISDKLCDIIMDKYKQLPPDTTSSMHGDFCKAGKTEFNSLTRYISEQANLLRLETPFFNLIIEDFDSGKLYSKYKV